MRFCKDVRRVGISKGESAIRSQFQEKCHEGKNLRKGVVVTKGHIQGEVDWIMRKEGGDDAVEAGRNGMCCEGVGGMGVGEQE